MHTIRQGPRAAAVAAATAALLLPFGSAAFAADPTPGSSQGGKAGPDVPAGYRVTTGLPAKISVATASGATSLTATVSNKGTVAAEDLRLSVVGYKGLTVKNVEGCVRIPTDQLPKDSNSGFSCSVGGLAIGKSRAYKVTAQFDLKRQGQICLPVTLGHSKTLLWQQGPVDFGTSQPIADAPDTPLSLGTPNVPAGGPQTTPAPSAPSHKKPPVHKLPRTGAPPLAALTGLAAGLLTVGGAGLWLAGRRAGRR
ncbi:hypothetical protein [Streptomyces sp. MST-110588]|uniref:hypothetical protein n=1 Tax=Streptomyces sp. MST-110588 TaxID=2833628 RepID=UPI001F5DB3C6|nr:hypothetical protein [Streptomyces sp. MST-110588]UNO41998.1 hypothetical protein KGS77_23795 [Streptomyces sp. MST-110588]